MARKDRPTLRLYLSARTARREELRRCAREARARGLHVTSRWVDGDAVGTAEAIQRAAVDDLADLLASDICVSFTDGMQPTAQVPTSSAGSGGRHVELGYALGRGIRVMAVGPAEHLFHDLPEVTRVEDWPQALSLLLAWRG